MNWWRSCLPPRAPPAVPPSPPMPGSSAASTVPCGGTDSSADSGSVISEYEGYGDGESVVSGVDTAPPRKRKRLPRRPKTIGAYDRLKLRKAKEAVYRQAEKEKREESQMDEALPLKINKKLPALEDLMGEMSGLPTPDITAEIMRYIDGMARIAQVYSNRNGTGKKLLNEAALSARAALTTLAIRAQQLESETSSSKELEALRK